MAHFRTCHTCALPAATCPARANVQAAIAGLGITSIRHRCPSYAPAFLPGDPVKVLTIAWYHRDDDPPPKCWFPGHFIRLSGQRALAFVPAGAEALNDAGVTFEPAGSGYLKVPLGRVAHRNGEAVDVQSCTWCAAIPSLGQPCGRDPHYTPERDCLVAQRASQADKAAA